MSTISRLRWLTATAACIALNSTSWAQSPSTASTSPHGALPASNFSRFPDISDLKISPDGNYVAALVPLADDEKFGNLMAILDAQTGKVLKVINSGHKALISDYFWVGNDRLVGSVAVTYGTLDIPFNTGELFSTDREGRHTFNLFGMRAKNQMERQRAGASFISNQPVDDTHVLIEVGQYTVDHDGSYTDIDLIDTTNGSIHGIGVGPAFNASFIADHAGQVRVAIASKDLVHHTIWTRADNNSPWVMFNDSLKSNVHMLPIGFNRENTKLYLRVAQPNRPDAIELVDLSNHTFTTLFQGQFADPGKMLSTADGKDYYAVISEDGIPSLHYFDENSTEAQLNKALAINFPGQLAYFSSFSSDGQRAIVTVVSDRNPGDYYIFDLPTHHAQFLASAMPWIRAADMRPRQPIAVTARDGLILHGFLTRPAGDKSYPLVVFPHGGPYGIWNQWFYDAEAQMFANHGYAVLQINYRGSGGYGAGFEARGYRQWGLSMQDDITDATKWAISQGYAISGHICIYGASYGGYAALEGAVREPELYKCAIGYAGPYDLRVLLDKNDAQRSNIGNTYQHLVIGDTSADLLNRSPVSGVDHIKASLLLIHGGSDARVPYKNFQVLTAALDKSGKHYESLVEMREGHGFYMPEHRLEAYQKMLDFLDRAIGPTDVAPNAAIKSTASP